MGQCRKYNVCGWSHQSLAAGKDTRDRPDHFLLIPGIGAQGGDLAEVARYGLNGNCGLIVNSSRAILFADSTERFAEVAAIKAKEVQMQMHGLLTEAGFTGIQE